MAVHQNGQKLGQRGAVVFMKMGLPVGSNCARASRSNSCFSIMLASASGLGNSSQWMFPGIAWYYKAIITPLQQSVHLPLESQGQGSVGVALYLQEGASVRVSRAYTSRKDGREQLSSEHQA